MIAYITKVIPSQSARGALAAALGFFSFTLMDFVGKSLLTVIRPIDLFFYSSSFTFLACAGYSVYTKKSLLNKTNLAFHVVRALFHSVSAIFVLSAFARLQVSLAYSVLFASPLISVLISRVFLKDRFHKIQIFGVLLGFLGVLLVLRPGWQPLNLGHLFAFFGAVGIAVNANLVRKYGQADSPLRFVLIGSFCGVVVSCYPAMAEFHWYTTEIWLKLLLSAALFLTSNLLVVYAFLHTRLDKVGSLQYTQIVWSFLIEFVFFGLVPQVLNLLGAMVVIVSGAIVMRLRFWGFWKKS